MATETDLRKQRTVSFVAVDIPDHADSMRDLTFECMEPDCAGKSSVQGRDLEAHAVTRHLGTDLHVFSNRGFYDDHVRKQQAAEQWRAEFESTGRFDPSESEA